LGSYQITISREVRKDIVGLLENVGNMYGAIRSLVVGLWLNSFLSTPLYLNPVQGSGNCTGFSIIHSDLAIIAICNTIK